MNITTTDKKNKNSEAHEVKTINLIQNLLKLSIKLSNMMS
jgi:hypothetical protein